ncbi:hypothetical protein CW745_03650 [Psychromonas sp. psych-6C06]|uniref:DUF6270 domain-containing protein n=1 Tax=Psychromonas sp. psych-6C06 TaxID=2058089 RepID=UPI000C332668|nr:DUF6270 domain-containing protein [Psychromonas sp. psych-6C06]PKF62532.1 hypothetical protein CW745_03650 [Psychromonas sp. psych-6C06]
MKCLIVGSCVTRDIFEVSEIKKLFNINYHARTSLASFLPDKFEHIPDTESIKSKFQAKMVEFDLNKQLFETVKNYNPDLILIDLIDERLDLCVSSNGSIATMSPSFKQLFNEIDFQVIRSGTEEHFSYWLRGWNNFIEELKKFNLLDKVRLNKVYWCFPNPPNSEWKYSKCETKERNDYLDKLYNVIESVLDKEQVYSFPLKVFTPDFNHKWGIAPFHYILDYRLTAAQKLKIELNREKRER